jgi:hypothetical protein
MKKINLVLCLVFIPLLLLAQNIEDVVVTVPDLDINVADTGDTFWVEIETSELTAAMNVTAFQFDLSYDVNILSFETSTVNNTIVSGGTVLSNIIEEGVVRTAYMATNAIIGEGVFVKLQFTALENGFSPLHTEIFKFNSVEITNLNHGSVTVDGFNKPATPEFSPEPGVYYEPQSISLSCQTENSTIYYTLDGSPPDSTSLLYNLPIQIDETTTIKAIAYKEGMDPSNIAVGEFMITGQLDPPSFDPDDDSTIYYEPIDVNIAPPEETKVSYSTDGGDTWQTGATDETIVISLGYNTNTNIMAKSVRNNWQDSEIISKNYTVTGTVANPTFSPESGLYTDETDVIIESSTENATIMYRTATDGGAWTDWQTYTDPITVPLDTQMDFEAYAEKTDWITSETISASYTVTGTVAEPTFSPEPGLYTDETDVIIETATENATIMYRTATDGGTWTDWQTYTEPITVPLDTQMDFEVYAEKTDWITSETISASYTVTGTVAAPTFSPEPGLYTDETDVIIDTATENATIMYRTATDGGTWTDWQTYTEPITIPLDTQMDFEAYAEKTDWITSETISASYTVTGTVAAPTFSPESGLYTDETDVIIDTATENATIMYRTATDGGVWTDWQTYTEPITVPLDTQMDFEAYAEKTDWITSETISASYTVTGTVASPTFSPEPGLYTDETDVIIDTATENATIMYRTATDGGAWTDWQIYTEPITVPLDTQMDFEAYAEKTDWITSDIYVATFTVTGMLPAPVASPQGDVFTEPVEVTLTCSDPEADIYYTLDGSDPDLSSYLYTEPINIATSTELRAGAFREMWTPSDIISETYTITGTLSAPQFSLPSGIYQTAQTLNITPPEDAQVKYRINEGEWTTAAINEIVTIDLPLQSSTSVEAQSIRENWSPSSIISRNYVITDQVETPEFSPEPGLYTTTQFVSISCATDGAQIYYTTDGSMPTQSSELYTAPIEIPLDSQIEINAKAFKEDWTPSEISTATYTITGTVATPAFSPESGLYTDEIDVTIETTTENATILYRTATDGGVWTDWQTYTEPITVPLDAEMDFEAYAEKTDWITSETAEASYTITGTVATPTFSPESGLYTDEIDVTLETTTENATIMYRTATDGGVWTDWQAYTEAITIALNTEMDFEAYAEKTDWITSETAEASYTITGTVATPTFSPESGLYTDEIDVTLETTTENATIMYRTATDGGAWTDWQAYSEPITVPLNTEMDFEAYAEKTDWITSETAEASYTITGTVATPTFSPESGLYTDEIDVTLETTTENATIMYRTATDGGAWTDWQAYSEPITVPLNTEMDFEAYAEKTDWITSETAEASYTITGTVATPTFSPESGLYTDEINVTIETTTENATIMYRTATDGGVWTDWQTYTEPITVPLNTEMDFEAYAEKTDWITSETAEASYTITGTVATPAFSPESGLYTDEIDVTIETTTEDATIMYRTATDGGVWTDWQTYTEPITVPLNTEMDFEAYAEKTDWITSETAEASYAITGTVATPEFNPEGGIYLEPQTITITTTTIGATIEYSFDGENWIADETVEIEYSTQLFARASLENWIDSDIAETEYHILNPPQNLVADGLGGYVQLSWQEPYSVNELILTARNNRDNPMHTKRQIINRRDSDDLIGYNIYRQQDDDFVLLNPEPITVTEFEDTELEPGEYTYHVTALYEHGESNPSNTASASINMVAIPTFAPEPGFYDEAIELIISSETDEADIYFTLDGSEPTQESLLYVEPVYLDSTVTVKARAFYDSWLPSLIAEAYYEIDVTDASEDILSPMVTTLHNAYPNPFNPITTISFSLAEFGNVNISIYNIRGQHIKTLINEAKSAGKYQVIWDGTDNQGKSVSSGIYLYAMRTEDKHEIKKCILLK